MFVTAVKATVIKLRIKASDFLTINIDAIILDMIKNCMIIFIIIKMKARRIRLLALGLAATALASSVPMTAPEKIIRL